MLGLKRFGRLFFLAFYVVAAWFLCSLLLQYFRRIFGKSSPNDILDRIDINCESLFLGNDSQIAGEYTNWNFDAERYEEEILYSTDRCATVKRLFRFNEEPLSSEEAAYPLAYGMIVYKDIVQVLLMLSSFYHPQNEYCLAVSGSSKPFFQHMAKDLSRCWPNVHFMQRGRIFWGSFEIINATYGCMEMLTKKKSNWQYFQYLSGVDAPLKTNLEMVQIFKAMNGTFNSEIKSFQKGRLKKKNMSDSPLPLFKSSLSALVPRSAAEEIVSSEKTHDLMMFLNGTGIPDEGFWSTLGANRKKFPIPGSIDGNKYLIYRAKYYKAHPAAVKKYTEKVRMRYYISRYQVWMSGCKGKMKSASCVFGVGDLPTLIRQPHLVAHKFYLDFQPAAFFCVLKEIRRRTAHPIKLNSKLYASLPQVELNRGVPFSKLSHPLWLF